MNKHMNVLPLLKNLDWYDLDKVINVAKQINAGTGIANQVVIQHPGRSNYNITHRESAVKRNIPIVWQP